MTDLTRESRRQNLPMDFSDLIEFSNTWLQHNEQGNPCFCAGNRHTADILQIEPHAILKIRNEKTRVVTGPEKHAFSVLADGQVVEPVEYYDKFIFPLTKLAAQRNQFLTGLPSARSEH